MNIPAREDLRLFFEVEHRARNFALDDIQHPFDWHSTIHGLLSADRIAAELAQLDALSVDDYITRVLDPAESIQRPSAKSTVQGFRGKIFSEFELGPLYSVEMSLEHDGQQRRVGIIAQNRSVKNGVWGAGRTP